MLTVDEARRALSDRQAHKIAERTGLHINTIKRIASGKNTNPSFSTMAALSAYLETIPPDDTNDTR